MKPLSHLLFLAVPAVLSAQAPAADPQPAPAIVAPTREKPQIVTGRMSMGAAAPTYAKPGRAHNAGSNQIAEQDYPIQVPPKTKLKVQLKGNPRLFRVVFVGGDMGRTQDPGLSVNRVMGRSDAQFYDNRSNETKTIYCVVLGQDEMKDEPYELVFTDY